MNKEQRGGVRVSILLGLICGVTVTLLIGKWAWSVVGGFFLIVICVTIGEVIAERDDNG